jgi:hypothetical protein
VLVPEKDLGPVIVKRVIAGAVVTGADRECRFRVGTGTFFVSNAANPAVGEKRRREEVA